LGLGGGHIRGVVEPPIAERGADGSLMEISFGDLEWVSSGGTESWAVSRRYALATI